ncbi:MAG: hypothetical protein ACK55E_13640 [Cyanobacteriota bacterium]|jgi:hypothetical protein
MGSRLLFNYTAVMAKFTATSASGDFSEALRGAIRSADEALNALFFTWKLEDVSGTVGGFVGAKTVSVTIEASDLAGPLGIAPVDEQPLRLSDWHAWHDRMPGAPQTLHVVGTEVFPTAGYRVELRPRVPQGINPSIYILDKIVYPPEGEVAQVETEVQIHYREATSSVYTSVTIYPDDITIEVREVA